LSLLLFSKIKFFGIQYLAKQIANCWFLEQNQLKKEEIEREGVSKFLDEMQNIEIDAGFFLRAKNSQMIEDLDGEYRAHKLNSFKQYAQ
jgi:hypothetical protein